MKRILGLTLMMALLATVACEETDEEVGCIGRDSCLGSIFLESSKDYAERRINETFSPLRGKSKKDVVLRIGAPSEIQKVDPLEIFIYFNGKGSRTETRGSVYATQYGAFGNKSSRTYDRYNLVRCYFENDKLIKYDYDVKR